MRRAALPVLTLAAGLAGCIPLPHHELTQPEVDGVLTSAGVPRAGVVITACQGLPGITGRMDPAHCDGMVSVTTDAQGRFHLPSHERFSLVVIMDSATWDILSVESGGRTLGWKTAHWRPAPPYEALDCELGEQLTCKVRQAP